MYTKIYKIALLGCGGVGKTSLIRTLNNKSYDTRYKATSGILIYTLNLTTDYEPVTLQIYDYSGQEMYSHQTITDADLSIIMYDLTNTLTYKRAMNDWTRIAGTTPILYVANKSDIPSAIVVKSNDIKISCRDPDSITELKNEILHRLVNHERLANIF